MKNPNLNNQAGIFISYDRSSLSLKIVERATSEAGSVSDRQVFEFSFSKLKDADHHLVEKTLGEIILYTLEKATPSGLGFGDYGNLLDRISEENLNAFSEGINLNDPEDQYNLATVLFSHGRRAKSWEMIERAIVLFKQAALEKHVDAIRFLEEDLPVVLPRLEEKFKPGSP